GFPSTTIGLPDRGGITCRQVGKVMSMILAVSRHPAQKVTSLSVMLTVNWPTAASSSSHARALLSIGIVHSFPPGENRIEPPARPAFVVSVAEQLESAGDRVLIAVEPTAEAVIGDAAGVPSLLGHVEARLVELRPSAIPVCVNCLGQ